MHRCLFWIVWLITAAATSACTVPTFAAPPAGQGWQALFDGAKLDRWRLLSQDREHWKVIDGVIDCDALASRALWTKESFGDFQLHVEWRMKTAAELYGSDTGESGEPIPNSPNSGILLRGTAQAEVNIWAQPVGSGQIWAYHRGDQSEMLTESERAVYCPASVADRPIGQWNTFLITLRGEQLTVALNGCKVIDDVRLFGIPDRGPIGLQQHGGIDDKTGRYRGASSTLQFRNVYIQPLDRHKDTPRPNFVLILIDDLGWHDVGYMGNSYYQTPQIDRLARQGMVFTDAYANAPNCMPSRACLITGQYTPRHGVYNIASPDCQAPSYLQSMKNARLKPIPNRRGYPRGTVTLPRALKTAGYSTGFIGKWHHGQSLAQSDFDFTASEGTGLIRQGDEATPEAIQSDPKHVFKMTAQAETFLEENRGRPFFLFLSHYAVHTPVEAQAEAIAKYRQRPGRPEGCQADYAAMVEHTDQSVGRLLKALDRLDLADNTMVILFSDNGGEARCTSNAPLRGAKQEIYEGGIRVPMIVRWPGRVAPGTVCRVPVIGLDLYPTLLGAASAPPPESHLLDGESLLPLLLRQGSLAREAIFWHIPSYWYRCVPCCAMRVGDYKLIEFFDDPHLELYDLKNDLSEQHDLAARLPETTGQLHNRMLAWRRATAAPVPTEPNPLYDPK